MGDAEKLAENLRAVLEQATEPQQKQLRLLKEWLEDLQSRVQRHDGRLAKLEAGAAPKVTYTFRQDHPTRIHWLDGPDIATPADWREIRRDAEELLAASYALPVKHNHFQVALRRILETARKFEGGK